MAETPVSLPTSEKKEMVRNLYLYTNYTQSEIAEIVDISQKTVSVYIAEANLALIKKRNSQSSAIYLEQMDNELQELNNAIASRPPGQRFPTKAEAEIRRKTLASMAVLRARQSPATHLEVLTNFLQSVALIDRNEAIRIMPFVDSYIAGDLDIHGTKIKPPYSLPTDQLTNLTGTTP